MEGGDNKHHVVEDGRMDNNNLEEGELEDWDMKEHGQTVVVKEEEQQNVENGEMEDGELIPQQTITNEQPVDTPPVVGIQEEYREIDTIPLTEEEEMEAARMRRIAERAELRASERMLIHSLHHLQKQQQQPSNNNGSNHHAHASNSLPSYAALSQHAKLVAAAKSAAAASTTAKTTTSTITKQTTDKQQHESNKRVKGTNGKFKFDWPDEDDTAATALNYDNLLPTTRIATTTTTPQDRLLHMIDARTAASATNNISTDWREKTVAQMTDRDWRIVREDHEIKVKGQGVPYPIRKWSDLKVSPQILDGIITRAGYTTPTPIQMQAIPCGLLFRDVIGLAETGSGKTCAFVVPLLAYLENIGVQKRRACAEEGPLATILAPTRELAQQIEQDIHTLSGSMVWPARALSVVGGNSIEAQGFVLRQGCDIVCATPGRLIDCMDNRLVVFNQCAYVVLDEADRMIDMGFEPQVTRILSALVVPREERITIMFSATMPPLVERIAEGFMKKNPSPCRIEIGDPQSQGNSKNIEQRFAVLSSSAEKEREMEKVLRDVRLPKGPIIVFCNLKETVDVVYKALRRKGFNACVIHSGRSQEEREGNLKAFKSRIYDVLVSTEVTGRGIDVEGVVLVLNYDAPTELDKYKHRIGRTGRAGNKGIAMTFFVMGDRKEEKLAIEVNKLVKSMGGEVGREFSEYVKIAMKEASEDDGGRGFRDVEFD